MVLHSSAEMHDFSLAAIGFLVVAVSTVEARAQSAEAEGMFVEGDRLMAAGEIAQACDAFEASNRVEQRAGTLIRLGECRERNHQFASAWSAYKDALTRVKDPNKRAIALSRATALEASLSYLTISVPDESRIDELQIARNGKVLDPLMWNRAVPIDGGQYTIAGRAPGHEEWRTTVTVPDEHGKVTVDVPKFKEIKKLITSTPARSGFDDAAPSPRSRALVYGLGGGGVALGVVAVVLEVAARSKVAAAEQLCGARLECSEPSFSRTTALLDGAALRRDAAIAAGVLATASVGVALYVYLRPRRSEPRHPTAQLHVVPVASEGAFAVLVDGRF